MSIVNAHIIRQLSKPTIVLDELSVQDTEYGTSPRIGDSRGEYPFKFSKMQGLVSPLVQINNVIYRNEEIVHMLIETTNFVPTVNIIIQTRQKVSQSTAFPKDGDIVSVFIRSKDDVLKPIRNDFEITSIEVDALGKELSVDTMRISGVLYIPNFSANICYAHTGTSFDVLKKFAENNGLGFASNELETKDKQTWISPFFTPQNFIADVTNSSWKDSSSFFTSFVDIFYNLNFVNVEPLISIKSGVEQGIGIEHMSTDFDPDSILIKSVHSILLTNHPSIMNGPFWIKRYEQKNLANSINRKYGYIKYSHFYDAFIKEKLTLFNDPLSTPGAEENMYIMKGRNKDNTQRFKRVTHDWLGTIYGQSGENCHSNYLYAKSWNSQNMVHLDKFYLNVELSNINMNLRKYQVIPLVIVIKEDNMRKIANSIENEIDSQGNKSSLPSDGIAFTIDKFYTGDYVIKDISYRYSNGQFTQNIKLMRREWPIQPIR